MSIEKKSLISKRASSKKANLTKVSATKVPTAKLAVTMTKAKLSTPLAVSLVSTQVKY